MSAPKNAKKPTDHKPKAETDGRRTIAVRGVEVNLPADALDDFELLDDLGALEDGNGGRLPRVLRRLAGDSYGALLDTVRDDDGRVSVESGGVLVQELLEALDPNS